MRGEAAKPRVVVPMRRQAAPRHPSGHGARRVNAQERQP